ncbi:MAG: capsule polysaccharide transporter [Campylobacterales bacterium]|nr:capsule polysaccharide transporter [Campylobacterales bacterium]
MLKGYRYYFHNLIQLFGKRHFVGWGRKRTGRFASWCYKKFGGTLFLQEDGFIRSIGLGVDGSPSFSIVEDDIGIYYDATTPSKLENILNSYKFSADNDLMATAREAMTLIRRYRISKYNNAPDVPEGYFGDDRRRILIVAQTAGDASLKYGLAERFTTDEIIDAVILENPDAEIWLKIHPDVISGKKGSDIDIASARIKCRIIDEDFNPISLLEHFDAVYTKTSQMGFEALMLGKKCVCFGMPFYAGWGITDDRVRCRRRTASRSVEEVFAGAYILYSKYYNLYKNRQSNIFDTINEIVLQRDFSK